MQGKRPRFALTAEQAHRLTNLLAIDQLLTDLFGSAAWALCPIREISWAEA